MSAAPTPPAPAGRWVELYASLQARPAWLHAACLAAWLLLNFAPALGLGFVWDDDNVIVEGPGIRAPDAVQRAFTHDAMQFVRPEERPGGTWRPLSLAYLALEYKLFGPNPALFHLGTALLHVGAMLALWSLLRRPLGLTLATATCMALGVHATTVESVVWVNGLSEPICLLFGALAWGLLAHPRLNLARAAAASALLLLALMGKETGLVFVGLAPLAALALREPPPSDERGVPWRRAALGGLAGLLAVAAWWAIRRQIVSSAALVEGSDLGQLVFLVPGVWFLLLQQALLPLKHAPTLLGVRLGELSHLEGWLGMGLAAAAVLGAGGLLWRRRWLPLLGLGWWFVGTAPALFLIFTLWPGFNRWLYLGLPGLALLGLGLTLGPRLEADARRPLAALALGGFALLQAGLLHLAMPDWKDGVSLWGSAARQFPDAQHGYAMLAIHLSRRGHWEPVPQVCEAGLPKPMLDWRLYEVCAQAYADEGQCARAMGLQRELLTKTGKPPGGSMQSALECWKRAGDDGQQLEQHARALCDGFGELCVRPWAEGWRGLHAPSP